MYPYRIPFANTPKEKVSGMCYPITSLIYPRISNTRNINEVLNTMFVYFYPITFHIDSHNFLYSIYEGFRK